MNRTCSKVFLLMLAVCLFALASFQVAESAVTNQQLDDLLAPIALYPDPILAELLPASTYPEEIADAAFWVRRVGNTSRLDEQNWDESVRAVAHYPDILTMMADNMDWTANVGDAFLNQPEDVTNSIQRLRWRARDIGNLVSTNQQSIIIAGGNIQIVPAQSQFIYVPQYDPSVIYVRRWTPDVSPFMLFGLGLAIGGWLNMDFDWDHRHVIYHGWNRHGWVNNARPYVHVTNVYINKSRPSINQAWRHDTAHAGPDKYWASHPSGSPRVGIYPHMPAVRGRDIKQVQPSAGMFGPQRDTQPYSNRGKESRNPDRTRPATTPSQDFNRRPTAPPPVVGQRPTAPPPVVGQRPTAPPPVVGQRPTAPPPVVGQRPTAPPPVVGGGGVQASPSRGRVQPSRTPSTNFGGYRGAAETSSQSVRGQASRQSSVEKAPPPVPAGKANAPAGRTAPENKKGKEDKKRFSR